MTRYCFTIVCAFALWGCGGGGEDGNSGGGIAYYDITTQPIPKLVDAHYLDLAQVNKVSRYRSGIGHAFNASGGPPQDDPFDDSCSSQKHYFSWKDGTAPDFKIFSPVDGTIVCLCNDCCGGDEINIQLSDNEAFGIRLMHVTASPTLQLGDTVHKNQEIGTYSGLSSYTDVVVMVNARRGEPHPRLLSMFDVMTDRLFQDYQARGAVERSDFIISKGERDAHPIMPCEISSFTVDGDSTSGVSNWVILN